MAFQGEKFTISSFEDLPLTLRKVFLHHNIDDNELEHNIVAVSKILHFIHKVNIKILRSPYHSSLLTDGDLEREDVKLVRAMELQSRRAVEQLSDLMMNAYELENQILSEKKGLANLKADLHSALASAGTPSAGVKGGGEAANFIISVLAEINENLQSRAVEAESVHEAEVKRLRAKTRSLLSKLKRTSTTAVVPRESALVKSDETPVVGQTDEQKEFLKLVESRALKTAEQLGDALNRVHWLELRLSNLELVSSAFESFLMAVQDAVARKDFTNIPVMLLEKYRKAECARLEHEFEFGAVERKEELFQLNERIGFLKSQLDGDEESDGESTPVDSVDGEKASEEEDESVLLASEVIDNLGPNQHNFFHEYCQSSFPSERSLSRDLVKIGQSILSVGGDGDLTPSMLKLKKKPLGSGGYGSIHQAELKAAGLNLIDTGGRDIVVKKMQINSQKARNSALVEVALLRLSNHPCIVHFCAAIEAESNEIWIVQEQMQGGTVKQAIEISSSLPLPLISYVVKCLSSAVAYLHSRGIVHRDIKPTNTMLTEDGRVKLIDLGLAIPVVASLPTVCRGELSPLNKVDASTVHKKRCLSHMAGSHFYMAPEFFDGNGYGMGVDVYAVGITAWEMFVGHAPNHKSRARACYWSFSGRNDPKTDKHILKKKPTSAFMDMLVHSLDVSFETRWTIDQLLQSEFVLSTSPDADQLMKEFVFATFMARHLAF